MGPCSLGFAKYRDDAYRVEPIAATTSALVELDIETCWRLLHDHHFGRLAFVVNEQPMIFPLNYAVVGNDVVFRSDEGLKMRAAVNELVAFQIDGTNAMYHEGWTVLLLGTMREELDATVTRELDALPLGTWVPGSKRHWIRISGDTVTGRRIERCNASEHQTDNY